MDILDAFEVIARDVEAVRQGERSGLTALRELRLLKKHIDDQIAIMDEYAQLEAEKYPGKSFQHTDGTRWTKSEGRRNWKYPGNPVIAHLKDEIELEQKKAQQAYEMTQRVGTTMQDGHVVLENGEMRMPAVCEYSKAVLTMEKS